ncbi:hypothetical protein BH09BAC1_BH09BAC1_08730 [soil metagenome]
MHCKQGFALPMKKKHYIKIKISAIIALIFYYDIHVCDFYILPNLPVAIAPQTKTLA